MKFAVIGTFYQRRDRTRALMERVMVESTRTPDEFWVMCEEDADAAVAEEFVTDSRVQVRVYPTPKNGDAYKVIPYSHKINWVLDHSEADAFVYLDNGSMPHRDKYRRMVAALESHRKWGAVYVGQHRTGHLDGDHPTIGIVEDAYCVLNYTQVMHRRTDDRWTLDMRFAAPMDLADALFWRDLHKSLGPFHPVGGSLLLDWHHIESAKAVGL